MANSHYPTTPGRVYAVPDSRLARVGFSGNRPVSLVQPGQAITPINMLPYQMAAQVPYGYTLQQMPMMQQSVIPPQRLMLIQPGSRNIYNVVDIDDGEDGDYVPFKPPQKRINQWIDELTDTPEMEELESKTRQIRRDADAALQRISSLGRTGTGTQSKKQSASDYFKNYDYSRIYKPVESEPRVSRAAAVAFEDEEEEPRYTRRSFRSYGRAIEVPPPTTASVKERINSVYRDIEGEGVSYVKTPKTYDFVHTAKIRDPAAKVQSEINRKAMLLEPGTIGRKGSVRRENLYRDPDEVRNNINFRAQYAAMREAAKKDYKKNNDYLLP